MPAPSPSRSTVELALSDLYDDLGELSYLCASAQARLAQLAGELPGACPERETREVLVRGAASSGRRYRALAARIRALRAEATHGPCTTALVERLSAQRASLADRVRVEQALLAALVAAADWQSPSFLHSVAPAAGRQTGRIRAHWNDYKRDRHADAAAYERQYVTEMIDRPAGVRALLTGSGMAAFTTILGWLQAEGRLAPGVLAGRGVYHETRLMLERMLLGRVRTIDETDTAALVGAIEDTHAGALFLDSLSNTAAMPAPDLGAVMNCLRGTDTYLILDNTCLAVSCQPFGVAGAGVRLVAWESLLKYAQLGMDRVNAGVIVARAGDAEALDAYREHLGTNIPDVGVHALPRPDRGVLERRLARLERNAARLAERLADCAPTGVAVVYPGRGGCLSIVPEDPGCRARLVEQAVAEAGRRGVRLLAGSSFGFDITRIYLTAARAEYGDPFVRVAAGTEHRIELEAVGDALCSAVRGPSLAATCRRSEPLS